MAQNTETKEIVAIKSLNKKYATWEECLQLSEVKALRKLAHPTIIKLKQVVRVINQAFFIFEFIEKDLFKLLLSKKQRGQRLKLSQIKFITRQLAESLQYIHRQGFFHRDLKPQNILINPDLTIKVIDFGISKQIRSKPPFTQYISTRWYRAPQLLFHFPVYSTAIDVFALGCIVAELYLMRPLFQGNSQLDQISKIVSVLGSPQLTWPDGHKQAAKRGINIGTSSQISLQSILVDCPSTMISFISACLKYDPNKRITPTQMLQHPFLASEDLITQEPSEIKLLEKNTEQKRISFVQNQTKSYEKNQDNQFDELLKDFTAMHMARKKKLQDDQDF